MNVFYPAILFGINPWLLGGLIVLGVLIIAVIVLYIIGRKMQRKNDEVMKEMQASAQWASALIIDKKHLRLKDAGFPSVVVEQTPKYARRTRVAVVKAKIGPQIHSLMCDEKIFDVLPVKKEAKIKLSGIYIMDARGVRCPLVKEEKKKKGFFARLRKKD